MAKFSGSYEESLTVSATPDDVLAQFRDLDQIVEHYGDLESAERLDAQTLRFVLTKQNHGVFSFQGRYDCRYVPDGDDAVSWRSEGQGGNIETTGHASVAAGPEPGTTTLRYQASMTLDIDVNKMLAPVLEPVVKASISQQMGAYVKRMVKAVERRS
ncbi:MAG: hypothetical protein EA397_08690 [Deltaproteobacteria bacterium]|nr:MAG: hypothetical protein EA397_08690 [Deltaproteobacteria bacterium]